MSFFSPISILVTTVIINSIIALFVFNNNPKSATNRLFFALSFLISTWLTVIYISTDRFFVDDVLFWARMSLFVAAPMNLVFFLFAHTLPQPRISLGGKYILLSIFATLFVMFIVLSPFTFSITSSGGQSFVSSGWGMVPFALNAFISTIAAGYFLYKKSRSLPSLQERLQVKSVGTGMLMMLILLLVTVLFPVAFLKNQSFIPYTPLYTLLFLGTTAYAIIKQRFLDIRLILARAISFLLFILLCATIYTLILFVFIQKILNLSIDPFTAISAFIIAVFAAISFQPMLEKIRRVTNRIFYKDNYESNNLLEKLSKIMTETIDLQYMTTTILNLMVKEMHLSKSAFLIIEKKKITDVVSVNYKKNDFSRAKLDQLMTKDLQRRGNLFFEELPEGRLKNLFRKLDISLIIPIKVENTYVALLVLGSKLSGEVYNSQDIHLLTVFASESGIAIRHANAYTQIKKFNELLEKKVAERTKSLQQQNKKIKEQNTEISDLLGEKTKLLGQQSDFLALAAHEFRTPLTVALLRTEDMLRKNKEKGLEDDLETMDEILKKLKELADKLYEILQYDFNKISLSPEKVNFYDFIEKIFESSEPLMQEKTLSFSIQNRLPRDFIIRLDPGNITQLLQNLIKNAVKLSPPKGKVSLTAKEDPKSVTLWVSDNGPGIPDKMKTQIFEKFSGTQGVPSLDVNLGLYVCKKIVELHRGKIWVEDNPNGGSIFIVSFPKQ